MVPPVPQILQPASLPNLPVIHHQQQPQVIYLQPVQPTEFIVVSKKMIPMGNQCILAKVCIFGKTKTISVVHQP